MNSYKELVEITRLRGHTRLNQGETESLEAAYDSSQQKSIESMVSQTFTV